MNSPTQIKTLENLFVRSCLEAAPRPVKSTARAYFKIMRQCDNQHSQLHQLKQRLLHAELEETPEAELFKRLCGAANEAAERAWDTEYPILIFPCLFEEMVREIRGPFAETLAKDPGFA
jgi:hypothetical protein